MTDDYGKPQNTYMVVAQSGNWQLLYDANTVGEKCIHTFRIQQLMRDVLIAPGSTLEDAKKRFYELVRSE
jgi:hypothetical protein